MTERKTIIGLVGGPGAGKDVVADYLTERYGANSHRFATPITDCLKRLGLEISRDNTQKLSILTREAFGEDLYAKIMAESCSRDGSPTVIANGIRRPADIEHLRRLNGFVLVHVSTPPEIRLERMRRRGEKAGESDLTWEKFMEQENHPTESAIREVAAVADVELDNSGTLENLYRQIDAFMADHK